MKDYIDLPPMRSAFGGVALPGSKSISNRALLLAALADGMTEIRALLSSDDTDRMLDALDALGVQIEREEGASTCRVSGVGGVFPRKEANLFLGNAGTVFRPLTAVLAFAGGRYRLSGVPRMHERPIADLVEALRRLGAQIRYLGKEGFPPLEILPPQASPGKGERLSVGVRGDVSSQFLTALLMALPLAGSDANVQVVGELISKPYIEITLNLMARFGVRVQREGWRRFTIPGGQRYRAPSALQVEGDASSASYFLAAGAIAGGPVRVAGVGRGSIQGDVRFVDELERMGARIAMGEDWVEARAPASGRLRALDADVNHIPDAAMTLAITALFADGTSTLRNIASWRVKETDRLAAMAAELAKLGAIVEHGQDYLHITPPAQWTPATIDTYDDHRMAMCASLACLGGVGVRINDPGCVAKTFPDYFEGYSSILAEDPPVIAIDGPSASGKGTVAVAVAGRFGFHYLDSGALYRLVALAAIRAGVGLEDERGVAECATELPARFDGERVFLAEEDVTQRIREEEISVAASRVAALPRVRGALLARQREFRRPPGLVADGRDMGSVVFPDAKLKVFLTASAEARARRRHKQLMEKGLSASIDSLLLELRKRDSRDSARSVAPLQVCADAVPLDTTSMTSEEAVEFVVRVAFRPKPHGERAG